MPAHTDTRTPVTRFIPLAREVITPPPIARDHADQHLYMARLLIGATIVVSSFSMFLHELLHW
jgi:hypothetical protein